MSTSSAFSSAITSDSLAVTPGRSLPAMWSFGDAWLQVAYSGQPARVWRAEAAGSDGYAITGEVEILPGGSQQMNVLLAALDNEFVQVSFAADHGIDVFQCAADVLVVLST